LIDNPIDQLDRKRSSQHANRGLVSQAPARVHTSLKIHKPQRTDRATT